MELLNLLLADWVGRLSLFTVVFATGMIVFLVIYFTRQVMKAGRDAEGQDEAVEQDHQHPHHA